MTGTATDIHYRGWWRRQVLPEVLVNDIRTHPPAQRAVMSIDEPVG
jgi:hypothetical protein